MSSAATHPSPTRPALTSTRSLAALHRERWSLYHILHGLLGGYGPDPLPGRWVTDLEQLAERQRQPEVWRALAAGLHDHAFAPLAGADPRDLDALYKIGILARAQARALSTGNSSLAAAVAQQQTTLLRALHLNRLLAWAADLSHRGHPWAANLGRALASLVRQDRDRLRPVCVG